MTLIIANLTSRAPVGRVKVSSTTAMTTIRSIGLNGRSTRLVIRTGLEDLVLLKGVEVKQQVKLASGNLNFE